MPTDGTKHESDGCACAINRCDQTIVLVTSFKWYVDSTSHQGHRDMRIIDGHNVWCLSLCTVVCGSMCAREKWRLDVSRGVYNAKKLKGLYCRYADAQPRRAEGPGCQHPISHARRSPLRVGADDTSGSPDRLRPWHGWERADVTPRRDQSASPPPRLPPDQAPTSTRLGAS